MGDELIGIIEGKYGVMMSRDHRPTRLLSLTCPTPHRYTERCNLEVHLFNIQTKLRAAKQKNWYPPEGKLVSDINKVRLLQTLAVVYYRQ